MGKILQGKSLFQRLREYAGSDNYPFHMPGHKRQMMGGEPELSGLFSVDITEIDGFDDLHHADGILKDYMEWAAECYGADESRYLVNGSSSGILSAVCGCVKQGGRILVGRNCHKSVYHGILLKGLRAVYVYPQVIGDLGIQGGILPEDVERCLDEFPDIQAVMIVSPTYDGMVSDIGKIAQIVHRHGIPLLVDEAHGAHFPFSEKGGFPVSALDKGADVVVQSLHKTLPSPTQTAIIHMKGKYLREEAREGIKRYLSIFQSSSPSYVFMAAIERCIRYMDGEGRERLGEFSRELDDFYGECRGLNNILVLGKGYEGKAGIYARDYSKIILHMGCGRRDGVWLGRYLRQHCHLELEMCMPWYALALTSLWDSQEGLKRLCKGLYGADRVIDRMKEKKGEERRILDGKWVVPETAWTIGEAAEMETELCKAEECEGRVSADFIYVYPPGIPYVVLGEVLSKDIVSMVDVFRKSGLMVHGLKGKSGEFFKVVKSTG